MKLMWTMNAVIALACSHSIRHEFTMIELRPVNFVEDAEHLFIWRNDPQTRQNSIVTRPVGWVEHLLWLQGALKESDILIAIHGDEAVGVVRVDSRDEYYEFNWIVAPTARGRGYGRIMVGLAVQQYPGRKVARIKPENMASRRIAEAAGFSLVTSELIESLLVYEKTNDNNTIDEREKSA